MSVFNGLPPSDMFLPISSPLGALGLAMQVEPKRWAKLREENVKDVALRWTDHPSLVQVIDDPRLGFAQLVILRRDLFERLIAALTNLTTGRSAVRYELDQITKIFAALKEIAASDASHGAMMPLVEVVMQTTQRMRTHVVPADEVTALSPTPLTESEQAFAREQARRDAEDE